MAIRDILDRLVAGQGLTSDQTEALFEDLLNGRLDDAQIGAALGMIQVRGVKVEELIGAARVMRRHASTIPCTPAEGCIVLDTCGTGGAPKTFNISTITAIVAAAAAPGRVCVAKHGNRSRTGRGSAEVLSALGVNIDASTQVQARCLSEAGVCFCFAVRHHPAVRHASLARKSLGFNTIFNLIGPLTNPAGASHQLLGVFDGALVEPLAQALAHLGSTRAMVVHGLDGMDEITTTMRTRIAHLANGVVTVEELDPQSLGLKPASLNDLRCADLESAVRTARDVIEGVKGPARDIVTMNTAAALVVAEVSPGLRDGLVRANAALDSGAAQRTLDRLARMSHETAPS